MHRSVKHVSVSLVLICLAFVNAQPPPRNGRGGGFLRPISPPRFRRLRGTTISNTDSECKRQTVRSLTGRCTSAIDPALGEARRAQFSYFDVDSRTFNDEGLKSARVISNIVSDQNGDTSNRNRINELFVFFGQFIDHDFASTPLSDEEEPIQVPDDDEHLSQSNLAFRRSSRQRTSSSSRKERPISVLSSALDLSTVYGTDSERNKFLRVSNSCKLKTSSGNYLPFNTGNFINSPSTSSRFYLAGDTRANEHPMLTVMHTLFVREHNTICERLDEAVPDMSPSDKYEAARAINIAQYQKIIYEEWLPTMIGRSMGRYRGYQPDVDPTISLEFTTAGFRVGHTMVGNGVSRIDSRGRRLPLIGMEEMFFRAGNFKQGDMEDFLRGAVGTRAQQVDTMVVDALRNFLFTNVRSEEGIDLVALNLQRGRDHNVPHYNDLRERFTGRRARSFGDVTRNRGTQARLSEAYDSVDDIEAWIGLMAEDPSGSAAMGRTNVELWKREFTRLRDGDRWFYLDNDRHGAIPTEVLDAVPGLSRDLFSGRPLFEDLLKRNTALESRAFSTVPGVFRV
ncbi:Peroxinectin A [Gracilariopsis chorda]|uniref:Peroxinectin A n=1 Tax=Gracilariopsis chorda TaxID=448386 RepID=A0A2V3ILZ3_9FLOR|nr:Peroxinectin A [Gracilariopsis chorda]|eukprot:PXF42140.1 Peroxinectin A [Gracilariopsis chorda]